MNYDKAEASRLDLSNMGFSTVLSSIMVDNGYYIGHRLEAFYYRKPQTFKISAELETIDEISEFCSQVKLLTSAFNVKYDCEIKVSTPSEGSLFMATPEANPVAKIDESFSLYESYAELTRRGWGYNDTVGFTKEGLPMRRIAINRWNWHGKQLGNPVTFYHCFPLEENTNIVFSLLSDRAFTAWARFTGSVPFQDASGKIRESFAATHLASDRGEHLKLS